MQVWPAPWRHYPKRQRASVVYDETAGKHDELDDDDAAAALNNSDPATTDQGGSSDSDEDWVSEGTVSNPNLRYTNRMDPEPKTQETEQEDQG